MLDDVLIIVLVLSSFITVMWAALFYYAGCLGSLRKVPGKFDGAGWVISCAFVFGLLSLACAAGISAAEGGMVRRICLILINIALQPPLAFVTVVSGYIAVMAVAGRVAYGFRIESWQGVEPEEYRKKCRARVWLGAIVFLLAGAVAAAFLWPLI
jgi:hypothetical protein